jgi:uncharacterized delta-60 repeat protein
MRGAQADQPFSAELQPHLTPVQVDDELLLLDTPNSRIIRLDATATHQLNAGTHELLDALDSLGLTTTPSRRQVLSATAIASLGISILALPTAANAASPDSTTGTQPDSEPAGGSAGVASQLAIRTQPEGGVSGEPLATQPVIEILDAQGDLVTTDSTTTVTVEIFSGVGGTLGGTLTLTASAGVITFEGVTLAGTADTDYVLRFTSTPPLTSVESSSVTVTIPPPVPDTLDASFDPDANNSVLSMAVQSDGMILLGGNFTAVGGQQRNRIARIFPNGTLDNTFNPSANSTVRALAVDGNGAILLGGDFTRVGGQIRNRVARLFPNGTADTFNPNAGANAGNSVNTLAIESTGSIIVGGTFVVIGSTTRNRIARIFSNGTLDTAFNPNANGSVSSLAVQTDGRIIVSGDFSSIRGQTRSRIARLNSDGTVDTFNPSANAQAFSLAVLSDGKILLGGSFQFVGGQARNRVARIHSNGALDTGFDPNANALIESLAVDSNGRILLGGTFTSVGGTSRDRIARINSDGTLDTGFDLNANGRVASIVLQEDQKILIGGEFTLVGTTPRNRIARIN